MLLINESNEELVQAHMSFHVRVTFAEGTVIAIGETVLVGADKTTVLTASIPRKYTEISYSLSVSGSEYNL